jgi:hypothetical protein
MSAFSQFYNNLKDPKGGSVRKLLESFVRDNVRSSSLQQKTRAEQSELIQILMNDMQITFNKHFPPKDQQEELNNAEGIENCVCKNLYTTFFTPLPNSTEALENLKI